MTLDEREQFLADVHVGVVAVERPGRAPLAVPIWYGYEPGGEVLVWTQADSVKHRLIRDAGRFTITVQDERPPYRYVTVEGDVTAIEQADDAGVRSVAVRYVGEREGNKFADEYPSASSVVIRMHPKRWLSADASK